jgi:hypothetical protein
VATTTSELVLTTAVMEPDGVPLLESLTFQDFNDFPTRRDEAVAACTPNLTLPPVLNCPDAPPVDTL